ncbi:response regulator [Paenibacillaceae bacterium WGS1546]|uniref:response regulator transcription factor n=1 Tax=Cohnella sp. WGS1546 TaxID=3366810 RepID=UPI00372D5F53
MRLLIADDDGQIREGIKDGIDWSSLGIEEVLTASNGTEAFDLFTEYSPEIIVTDVRMPGMDGLELLKRVKEVRPATKVIILSGYNDFKYLKKAIQWDAADYEMKPIRARSLIRLIKKVREDIIREKVSEESFHKYLESHKELFVEELLAGRIHDRLIRLDGLMQYFQFDGKGMLLCVCIGPDRDGGEPPEEDVVAEALRYGTGEREAEAAELWLRTKNGLRVGLLKLETASYLYARHAVASLKNRLAHGIREAASSRGISLSAGISQAGNVSEFNELLSQAKEARALRLYDSEGSVHAYEESNKLRNETIRGPADEEEFKACIRSAAKDRVIEMIGAEFSKLRDERKYSAESLVAYCKSLIHLLAVAVHASSGELADFVRRQSDLLDRKSLCSIEDYADFVRSAYEQACDDYLHAGLPRLSAVVQMADEFIRKHYAEELNVERVAEYVGKTPNYFSHLFKKETGVPFREYVNRLRIAKAKELIGKSSDRIYEIGEKVGFSDYAYFTQVFKKLEGRPPTAFRNHRR